jgi:hypothetical protein
MKSTESIKDGVVFLVKHLVDYGDIVFNHSEKAVELKGGIITLTVWRDSFKLEMNDPDWSNAPSIVLSFNSPVERYGTRWIVAAKLLDVPFHDYVPLEDKVKMLYDACMKIDGAEENDDLAAAVMEMGKVLVEFGNDKMERKPRFQDNEIEKMSLEELRVWVREL